MRLLNFAGEDTDGYILKLTVAAHAAPPLQAELYQPASVVARTDARSHTSVNPLPTQHQLAAPPTLAPSIALETSMLAKTHEATATQLCRRRLKALIARVHANPDTRRPDAERQEMRTLMGTLTSELIEVTRYLEAAQPPRVRRLSKVGTTHGELAQRALAKVLRELFDEESDAVAATERGFTLIEVAPLSAIDMLGADMLVIARDGNFLLLDATANFEKIHGEQQREMPELRKQGLINLCEFIGHVEDLGLAEAEGQLKSAMRTRLPQLLKLAAASPLNLLDLRLPVVQVGNLWDQVNFRNDCLQLFFELERIKDAFMVFVSDLERLAAGTAGIKGAQLKALATHLKRGRSVKSGKSGPIHAIYEALRRVEAKVVLREDRRQHRPRRS